jgi:hypothetical protein
MKTSPAVGTSLPSKWTGSTTNTINAQKSLCGNSGDVPTPIAFSDEQLDAIMHAAEPLAPADRERFVEAMTAAVQGRDLGDGAVYLAIRKAQRQFFAPPMPNAPVIRGGGKAA